MAINKNDMIMYEDRKPDVYAYDDINFDPNKPESGKVWPSLNSLIIKNDGSLWYVAEKNDETYELKLKPVSISETENVKTISYGNDILVCYVDKRTNPNKLVVDSKLLFFGNNLIEYGLYRVTEHGEEIPISAHFDAVGTFISNRVPMASVKGYPEARYPTNCHTLEEVKESEPLLLRVFNNLGNIASEVTVFIRNGIWLNDLESLTNPIVEFDAVCLQMKGNDFYIYQKQDPSHLNIVPRLRFADGTVMEVPVDNKRCFMYGLEDFEPSYPGYSQMLVFKYFLSPRDTSAIATTQSGKRFITTTKKLIVVANKYDYSAKITTVPIFDYNAEAWKLKYYIYLSTRDRMIDITDKVTVVGTKFDGSSAKWGHEQCLKLTTNLQTVFDTDDELPYAQTVCITVWDPRFSYQAYTIRDNSSTDIVYGVESSIIRRPILHYDSVIEQYFIPSTIFGDWDSVVEAFYLKASPLFNTRVETAPPVPTHFLIRDSNNGQMLIGGPISKDSYGVAFNTVLNTPVLVGRTVIVEFLLEVDDDFKLLYGVPVDVKESKTGYNTETNNIY